MCDLIVSSPKQAPPPTGPQPSHQHHPGGPDVPTHEPEGDTAHTDHRSTGPQYFQIVSNPAISLLSLHAIQVIGNLTENLFRGMSVNKKSKQ